MCAKCILEEILAYRQAWGGIPADRVRYWMQSCDIEVQGAIADLLTYPPYWERVDPPISEEELERFLFPYYKRCFMEDPDGEWAATRYGAAREIVGWYKAVPSTVDLGSQTFLLHMKKWLEEVYTDGDEDIREAIITGALEHILEQLRWRTFFADWQTDPALVVAYDQAMQWAREHEQ